MSKHNVIHWIRRKYGEWTVQRFVGEQEATSLPCVLCRKVLDKMHIRWTAFYDSRTVTWEDAPPSKPTHRQRVLTLAHKGH